MIVFDRYKRELCRGTFVRGREALVSLCQKMRGGSAKTHPEAWTVFGCGVV